MLYPALGRVRRSGLLRWREEAMRSWPWCEGSDGDGELGERVCQPMVGIDVDAEFVVAAAHVLHEGVPTPITQAERGRLSPRVGRSRDFNLPWSASMRVVGVLLADMMGS